ncbi:MAG: hypothetical protein QXW52_09210 [Candidatus Caldarchaeum sp.]
MGRYTDVSRIVPHLLRPNDIAFLSFSDGLIPVRVLQQEFFNYLYDPIAEGQLVGSLPPSSSTDGAKNVGFTSPEMLKSGIIAAQPINVLRVSEPSKIYQAFIGVAPSYARIYYAVPVTAAQRNLDVIAWSNAYAAPGFIDGYTSPLLCPAPESELIVPYGIDPGIGYANILFEGIRPLLWFYVNKIKVGVIRDAELVLEMLDRRGRGANAPIKVVGGMTSFTYNYREVFRINPIPITATKSDVARILGGG